MSSPEATRYLNQRFHQADLAQKRQIIAQDVLDAIRAEKFRPISGVWVDWNIDLDQPLAAQVEKNPTCQVCALGAAFLCAVRYHPGAYPRDFHVMRSGCGHDAIFKLLGDFFEDDQLQMIEAAYEQGRGFCGGETEAICFGLKYEDDQERMIAIMQNILANHGTFVP